MPEYEVNSKKLECSHCDHSSFTIQRALLNTRSGIAFGSGAFDDSADVFVCEKCGLLTWFLRPKINQLSSS